MNRNSSCMQMVQGKQSRTEPPFANLQHRQLFSLAESSSVWGTRRNQGCKEDDQALQCTVCRLFPESKKPYARHIVMMKQHGRQQGSSFLPHGLKEVSVQYLLVRSVNHRKRSTKHVINCFHIIINSYLEMLNVFNFKLTFE